MTSRTTRMVKPRQWLPLPSMVFVPSAWGQPMKTPPLPADAVSGPQVRRLRTRHEPRERLWCQFCEQSRRGNLCRNRPPSQRWARRNSSSMTSTAGEQYRPTKQWGCRPESSYKKLHFGSHYSAGAAIPRDIPGGLVTGLRGGPRGRIEADCRHPSLVEEHKARGYGTPRNFSCQAIAWQF